MKFKRIFLAVVGALVSTALVFAAYTRQNARVERMQFDAVYNGAGTVTAVRAEAFLSVRLVNDSDPNDIVEDRTEKRVSFDLLDPEISSTTVTAAGRTVTYQQLAALLRQASLDRANAAGVQ